MKFLFLAVFLFSISTSSIAQTYYENKDLIKYAGEWVGVDGPDTFRVSLQYKERYKLNQIVYADAIVGCYSYSENGVVESSTMPCDQNVGYKYIFMMTGRDGTHLVFNEKGRQNGIATVAFNLVPGSSTKAIWKTIKVVPQEGMNVAIVDKEGNKIKEHVSNRDEMPESKITSREEWIMTIFNMN